VKKQFEHFSALVERIYEAALEPRLWPSVPEPIARLHASPQAMLFAVQLPGVEQGFMYPYGVKPGALEAWDSGAARDDIWVLNGVKKGLFRAGKVVRGEELVPDDELLASDYYRRFLKPHDSRYLLSGVIFDGSDSAPTSVCSVIRGHGDKAFGDADVLLHQLVVNHLSKAMGTMWRLRSRDQELASTQAALDRLSAGVLLLDERGAVRFANARARSILQARDGVSLRAGVSGDRLCATDPSVQSRLDRLFFDAVAGPRASLASHFSNGVRVPRKSGLLDYIVQVAPVARSRTFADGADGRAIVFMSDPSSAAALDGGLLKSVYGLTSAEIKLAEELLSGDAIPQIAARLKVSSSTARTQLLSVFEKTGTRRQAQLMKLLMSMRG